MLNQLNYTQHSNLWIETAEPLNTKRIRRKGRNKFTEISAGYKTSSSHWTWEMYLTISATQTTDSLDREQFQRPENTIGLKQRFAATPYLVKASLFRSISAFVHACIAILNYDNEMDRYKCSPKVTSRRRSSRMYGCARNLSEVTRLPPPLLSGAQTRWDKLQLIS